MGRAGTEQQTWCNSLGLSNSDAVTWAEEKEQSLATGEGRPLRAVAFGGGRQPACNGSTRSQRNTFTLLLLDILPCVSSIVPKQKAKDKNVWWYIADRSASGSTAQKQIWRSQRKTSSMPSNPAAFNLSDLARISEGCIGRDMIIWMLESYFWYREFV